MTAKKLQPAKRAEEVDAKRMKLVSAALSRVKKPIRAADLAPLAGLDVKTTVSALLRLRRAGLALEAGLVGPVGGPKHQYKTIRLWIWHTQRQPDAPPAYTPHLPSTQPNGSVEFWAKHMAEMNAPARVELLR